MTALLAGCLLTACNGSKPAPANSHEQQQTDKSELLRRHGKNVLTALRDSDFKALAAYIPRTGLRFSPYSHIDLFSDQQLTAQSLLRAAAARTRLSWGSATASGGATIVLSPQDYIRRYAYTADYLNTDSTAIIQSIPHDDKEQSIGNLYDGADCITYFAKGDGGLSSLRLFFMADSNAYKLLGLMHDAGVR